MDEHVYYSELLKAIEYHEKALKELRYKVQLYEDTLSTKPELFASRLRALMKKNGISQTELAKQIGVSQRTVSRYVTGESIPDKVHEKRIMTSLNICISRK